MTSYFKSPSGYIYKAPKGFSFTTLFFGFTVPLFRSDFKWAFLMYLFYLSGPSLRILGFLVANIIMAFIYNDIYYKGLIKKNYKLVRTTN